jgi:uncharacterized membrane protein
MHEKIVIVHAVFGVPALITFWIAALARKGGPLHRTAGRIYVASMLGLLATTVPLIAIRALEGRIIVAVFLGYLFLITAAAVWLSWRSIRQRRELSRFTGRAYRAVGAALLLSGLGVLGLSFGAGSLPRTIFMAGLSLVGIVVGSNMWWFIWRGASDNRWWLGQHMTGAALNFGATHASFFGLGLRNALPTLSGPWVSTIVQVGFVALALVLRLWLGRRYLRRGRPLWHHGRRITADPPQPAVQR